MDKAIILQYGWRVKGPEHSDICNGSPKLPRVLRWRSIKYSFMLWSVQFVERQGILRLKLCISCSCVQRTCKADKPIARKSNLLPNVSGFSVWHSAIFYHVLYERHIDSFRGHAFPDLEIVPHLGLHNHSMLGMDCKRGIKNILYFHATDFQLQYFGVTSTGRSNF